MLTQKKHLFLAALILAAIPACAQILPEKTDSETVQDTLSEQDSILLSIYEQRIQDNPALTGAGQFGMGNTGAFDNSKGYSTIPIYYGTDRMPSGEDDPYDFYTGVPNLGGLQFGKCIVTVPRIHKLGEIERPSWWSLELEDAEKHIILKAVNPMAEVNFFDDLHWDALKANKREALVFIHGFNVSFDEAALRAAQIVYDISFGGIPMMYSWPSRGNTLKYWEDGQNNKATVPNLQYFLERLAKVESLDRIHIVAHSMGNRALTECLINLAKENPNKELFGQIILAAPDVDAAEFTKDIVPKIQGTAQNITLYASSKDKALLVSKKINKGPRAGEGGNNLVVLEEIQTVDASIIDTDYLGHSYFATTWLLINDLYYLINKGYPADRRKLKDDRKNRRIFWFF